MFATCSASAASLLTLSGFARTATTLAGTLSVCPSCFCSPRYEKQHQRRRLTARSGASVRGRFAAGQRRASPPNSAEALSTQRLRERRRFARLAAPADPEKALEGLPGAANIPQQQLPDARRFGSRSEKRCLRTRSRGGGARRKCDPKPGAKDIPCNRRRAPRGRLWRCRHGLRSAGPVGNVVLSKLGAGRATVRQHPSPELGNDLQGTQDNRTECATNSPNIAQICRSPPKSGRCRPMLVAVGPFYPRYVRFGHNRSKLGRGRPNFVEVGQVLPKHVPHHAGPLAGAAEATLQGGATTRLPRSCSSAHAPPTRILAKFGGFLADIGQGSTALGQISTELGKKTVSIGQCSSN